MNGERRPISVLVPTLNEEEVLDDCLASVDWADEILVVDSGSTDRTLEIARAHGARILEHPYENSARQKNWAIPRCTHEWVLIVDADERVSPGLADEIRELLARGPEADGYWIRRSNVFLGRTMRHGGWQTDRVIRFFHRDRARYEDKTVHAEMVVDGPVPVLRHPLIHLAFRSFDQYWPKVDRYARWWAIGQFERGRRVGAGTVLAHTVACFLKVYVARAGFLDGGHGLVFAFLATCHVYLKYARLWELTLRERKGNGSPGGG